MDKVTIVRGQGGLGRAPLGTDYISGMVFYGTVSGWTSGKVKQFFSINDAITAGIVNTHVGETKAIIELDVVRGATGATVAIYMQEPLQNVLIASYTQASGDSTDTLLAASIAAAINAQTPYNGGYTATNTGGNLFITLRPGLGVWANANWATQMTFVYTGAITLGVNTFTITDGVASEIDVMYYHILRFFTQAPTASLYVSVTTVPSWSGYAFGEISLMQTAANGAVKQIGVYIPSPNASKVPFAKAQVTALQAQAALMITANTPVSIVLGADFSATTAAALTDRSLDNSEHVSVSVGQDGGNLGLYLFQVTGTSITQLGDVLGIIASAQVSDDIGWIAEYNLAIDGLENAVPALATGELLSALSSSVINNVDLYRYIFGTNAPNLSPAGTFINDSHTCTLYTSDYAYIENCRTFDKYARLVFSAYYSNLKAPLVVQANGTLTNAQVSYFEGVGEAVLDNGTSNNPNTGRPELSGYSVTINPAQDVLSTSNLAIQLNLQPIGVARNIILNMKFSVNVSV